MPRAVTTLENLVRPLASKTGGHLRFAIAASADMQALMAGLTCPCWRYSYHLYSRLNAFVLKELSQLVERPRVRTSSLSFVPGLLVSALSNSSQIFNSNNSVTSFGISNDSSTDCMVQPSLILALSPRQPFQRSPTSFTSRFCALRSLVLERSSHSSKLVSRILYLFSIPPIPMIGYCNVPSPKVNPNYLIGQDLLWYIIRQLNMQVVQAILMLTQLGASRLSAFKLTRLVISDLEFNMLPATIESQTSAPVFFPKGKDTSIIVSTSWLENFNWLPFNFGSLTIRSNSGTNSDSQISTQAKLLSNRIVDQRLNCSFAGNGWFDDLVGIVASISKRLQGCLDFGNLFFRRLELANQCQSLFHERIISHMTANKLAESSFLPELKLRGFPTPGGLR